MSEGNAETTLEELTAAECTTSLATQTVGRLGVNAEHYRLISVVNYGLDGDVVVIRTDPGTKLSNANHANVTFEVDELDHRNGTGWSVLTRGLAEEVTSAHSREVIARTKAAAAAPWPPGERGRCPTPIPQAHRA